jgi:hypothetical protein
MEWENMDRKNNEFGFNFDSDSKLENMFRVSKGFYRSKYDILRRNDDLFVRIKQNLLPDQNPYYVGFQQN